MNVLVIEDSSKSTFGGGQMVTSYVLEILYEMNQKIYLCDTSKRTHFKSKVKPYVYSNCSIRTYGEIKKGETSSFNITLFELLIFPFIAMINFFKMNVYLINNKLKSKDTIIYATTKKSLCYAYLMSFLGYEYIYHAHNYDAASKFFRPLKYLISRAKIVFCVSKFVKDSLQLNNTQLLYNPSTKLAKKRGGIINDSKIFNIAFVGSLIDLKGPQYFIESYQFLNEKEKYILHVFGDGELKDHLMKDIVPGIKMHGFVDDVVNKLDEMIDVVVLPSILEEACPMVVVESLSLGLPVVTTNIGGQAELIVDADNGFLVDIKSPSQIAKSIELICNSGSYNEFSEKSYQSSFVFNYNEFKNHIKNAFTS